MQFQLKHWLLWPIILTSLSVGGSAAAKEVEGRLTLLVVPKVAQDGSAASIEFRLRYDGSSSINASVATLPGERLFHFASFHAERFAIYDADPFVRCPQPKERIYVDDPGVGYKPMKPGQQLVQTIDLFKLYDNIGEILGKCDLVIHWTHKIDIEGGQEAPRMAGAIVFPATLDIAAPREEIGDIRSVTR